MNKTNPILGIVAAAAVVSSLHVSPAIAATITAAPAVITMDGNRHVNECPASFSVDARQRDGFK